MSRKLVALLVGTLFVVVILTAAVLFIARYHSNIHLGKTSSKKSTQTFGQLLPTPTLTASGSFTPTMKPTKNYTNKTFGYSIQIPTTWEAIENPYENASQTIVRPKGSVESPITINAQTDVAGASASELANITFGSNHPRETKTVTNREALLLSNNTAHYISYFLQNDSNLYEFSASTIRQDYLNIFNQILSSLTFTK